MKASSLVTCVEAALSFVKQNLNPDGMWSDFLTLAGESVYWVTGYVGYAVLCSGRSEGAGGWLGEVGSRLSGRQGANGGWGYGPGVPEDADSTAWSLLFLSRLGTLDAERSESAERFLLLHQSPLDGGFRTYARPAEIGRYMMLDGGVTFEGWSSSQTCVTGGAVKAMLEARAGEGAERGLEFIRASQASDGYWPSYWWTERLYATLLCMEALLESPREGDSQLVARAQDWIAGTQRVDGGWSDIQEAGGFAFATALAVKGLSLGEGQTRHHEEIDRGMEWLLSRQLPDGSWPSQYMLRIPHPSDREPWRRTSWRADGKAVGAVIKDHRRLFSTATVVRAISEYARTP